LAKNESTTSGREDARIDEKLGNLTIGVHSREFAVDHFPLPVIQMSGAGGLASSSAARSAAPMALMA
jgi:hypothetical protein